MAKDIWQPLLITHQEESIDSGFARFNTIITCLKSLDEGFSSKKYVRKFLRDLHSKWRAKVMVIKESKDLSSLALDELINSSDDETLTSRSKNEEYVIAVRNFKKFFRKKGKLVSQPREEKKSFRQKDERKEKSDQKYFRCGDTNHLISDFPKTSRNKDQKAFIRGSWSDSENDSEDKTNDETSLMAQSSNELGRSKEIDIAYKLCQEFKLENARLKETQAKFVKFDKSDNSLREMLDNQEPSSCKVGLGFDSNKASTSGTKPIIFVGPSSKKATKGSTIKVYGSTLHGSMSRTDGEILTKHVFSPPISFRSDFVITRKKLIHNRIDESKKPPLKPSPKSGIENGVTRTKKYEELSATKKIQVDFDLKATNIILQGLLSSLYSLVNHHKVAKDQWERVQLLMQVLQDACPQPQSIPKIKYNVSIVNQQTHLAKFPQLDSGLAVLVFKQGDNPSDALNKMMSFLSIAILSRFPTTNNQLRNSFNPREQATIHDGRELEFLADPGVAEGPVTQTVITHNAANQADDLDVYDSYYDNFSTAKAVLMANLSSYGSDVLFEIRSMLYDGSVIAKETHVISMVDSKETLMLEEESRLKMILKQCDPKVLEKKVNNKPINHAELNRLSKDFGKWFIPQQEQSDEQAF
uniref:Zf-CCHC domain-containing protein/UBN2 domain-containing protein n=1 Tax=Tanacetum cinerariifolium TaxID=118510 RepID=A0A699H9Q1_TANCI|nr:hypothetical protein [Tanacetum cinerariifolium]